MRNGFARAAALVGALCVSSCTLGPGKPVSGLIEHPLQKDNRYGEFDGIWFSGAKVPSSAKVRYVYVAPVDVQTLKNVKPGMSAYLAGEFRQSLQKEVAAALNRAQKETRWKIADTPRSPGVTLSLSIVKLKPSNVTGKVAALGAVPVPVPGVSFLLNEFSKGSVGIEGRVADNSGRGSFVEFAACNSDPINIFSCNQFEHFACGKYNLDLFAEDVAALLPAIGVGATDTP